MNRRDKKYFITTQYCYHRPLRRTLHLPVLCSAQLHAQKQYKIVYNVLEDKAKDNYEIYSMNMDGTDKKNITNTPGVEWVYYAYEDKVYYISDIDTCHRCYFLI